MHQPDRETAYFVTIYRDEEGEASVDVRGLGWWTDRDFAERLAKREVMNDPQWLSATIDRGHINRWRTSDGIEMADFEDDGETAVGYAIFRRDGRWVIDSR